MSMNIKKTFMVFLALLFLSVLPATAQVEIVDDESVEPEAQQPETGKKAAREYFIKRKKRSSSQVAPATPSRSYSSTPAERYLSLHLGVFFDEESYKWGHRNDNDVSELNAGVTYRIGEWVNSMDMNFRGEVTSYSLNEGKALKLSLLPLVTFPDVRSQFPLYFGAGAGLGIFFKQIKDESHVSFDYQVVAGARLFDLVENMGLMAEVGMKNHVLLLSDGQFNGAYFSLGAVFEF